MLAGSYLERIMKLPICLLLAALPFAACTSENSSHSPRDLAISVDQAVNPLCIDGIKNGTETDSDCGGVSCTACDTNRRCLTARDCQSGVCTGGACAAPACNDRVRNGSESDTDCGGSCAGCAAGSQCQAPGDCLSRACVEGRCQAGPIGTLKAARDSWSLADGVRSESADWLKAPPPMGAGLTVSGVDELTDASLASFQSFILIFDSEAGDRIPNLSEAEAQALKRFVLKGGSVAIFYGHRAVYPTSLVTAFSVDMKEVCEQQGMLSFTQDLPAALAKGPFGELPATLAWQQNCHENVLTANSKAVLLAQSSTRQEAAYIPPGALGTGSGPVFFFGDWYWSYSGVAMGYPGNDGPGWQTFFRNTISYLMSH